MNFYEVSLLKSPLGFLTYQSDEDIKIGTKVLVFLGNRKKETNAVVIKKVSEPKFKCIDISEITDFYYDAKMLEIAKFISQYYVCSLGEALSIFIPFKNSTNTINCEKKFNSNINFSSEQENAYNFLKNKKQALLFADTGSGKTEIYIKTIEKVLNEGSNAILLMPEISLSPQMQKRLEKVFHKSVAIWHSKISKSKKEKILEGIYSGEIKLIAGARSALFLPFKDLKLIVVDEEHDESYKSDSKPRYNAKELALNIAKKFDINLI